MKRRNTPKDLAPADLPEAAPSFRADFWVEASPEPLSASKSSPREGSFYEAVYGIVAMVPRGKVATYGQIATILGSPRAARAVGYALAFLSESRALEVPWQRILNREGGISARGDVIRAELQQRLLEQEGLTFDADGHVDLTRHRWEGVMLGGRLPDAED